MLQEALDFLGSRKKLNLAVIAANIFVFIALTITGSTDDVYFMLQHGAAYAPYIMEGEYYRLFTSMWLHFGIAHLIYNMVCLLAMGEILEQLAGPVIYLAVYIAGGLAGNLLSLALDLRIHTYAVSAGASGAISAVIGTCLGIMLRNRRHFNKKILQRLFLMALLMVAEGFTQAGIDNAAHIGGMLFGLAAGVLCRL